MPGGLDPWTLLEWLRDAVAGAPTEGITQLDDDSWHEAQRPFTPTSEADTLGHLAFNVIANRWTPDSEQTPELLGIDRMPVSVLFCYHLRPDCQNDDYRACFRAAKHVYQTVNNTERWAHGAAVVEIVEKARVGVVPDEPYALVEVQFNVTFNPGD